MVYPIYVYGHPVLRRVAEDIDKNYEGLVQLIDDMFEIMHHSDGIGLAAPQIGKSIRLFVVDGTPISDEKPDLTQFRQAFINPYIKERSGEKVLMNEGCLSIPLIREEVNRESTIRIEYFDQNWKFHNEVINGFKARIIEHEYDHLDGVLFTDLVSPLKKRLLKSKLAGISKGKFSVDYKTVLPKHKIK
ncbi:MAG TPA: peptide deformylase [Bacteroidales bacterium]|mgnify:CR=1 FL=1|nr:peptide deformylase [Bacteroidales bacterium]